MSVAGLDLSLTNTGAVVLADARVLSAKSFKPAKVAKTQHLEKVERLGWLQERVINLVCRREPKLVVIEGYGFGAKNQAHSLGELGGIVKLSILQLGYPMLIVPPSTLKKFITGKGNSEKGRMGVFVWKRWKYEHDDNNVLDAFSLAKLGQAFLNPKTVADRAIASKCMYIKP